MAYLGTISIENVTKITKDFFSNKDIMETMNNIMKIWLSEALQESGLSQS